MPPEAHYVLRLAIGIAFFLAAVAKLRNPGEFARGITRYEILPPSLSNAFGILIIATEAGLAFAFWAGRFERMAGALALLMVVSFSAAVSLNLKRGRALPCYCFGGDEEAISNRTLVRLGLLGSGIVLLLVAPQAGSPTRPVDLTQVSFALFWAIVVLLGASWILRASDLAELLVTPRDGANIRNEFR